MKNEKKLGQMNDRGMENPFLYAPASASTLIPVPPALILRVIEGSPYRTT